MGLTPVPPSQLSSCRLHRGASSSRKPSLTARPVFPSHRFPGWASLHEVNAELNLLEARDRSCLAPQGIFEASSGLVALSKLFQSLSQGVLNTCFTGLM